MLGPSAVIGRAVVFEPCDFVAVEGRGNHIEIAVQIQVARGHGGWAVQGYIDIFRHPSTDVRRSVIDPPGNLIVGICGCEEIGPPVAVDIGHVNPVGTVEKAVDFVWDPDCCVPGCVFVPDDLVFHESGCRDIEVAVPVDIGDTGMRGAVEVRIHVLPTPCNAIAVCIQNADNIVFIEGQADHVDVAVAVHVSGTGTPGSFKIGHNAVGIGKGNVLCHKERREKRPEQ